MVRRRGALGRATVGEEGAEIQVSCEVQVGLLLENGGQGPDGGV